jgi:hypothetical protein
MTRLQALEAVAQRMRTIVAAREAEEGEGPITRLALDDAEQALDTLDAISADLAADGYAVEQDWQPIATAPKDGTKVLVYARVLHPEKWGVHLEPIICAASYHPDAGWCVCKIRDATHWRPLPTPPAAAKETRV